MKKARRDIGRAGNGRGAKEAAGLAANPEFLALLEHSRARYRAEGGISQAEMRKRLGLPPGMSRDGKTG
jgi:hypothetical protein